MTAAAKLAATCAYCLRPLTRLAAGSTCPIRHGWTANGNGGGANGQLGTWHSGPCKGVSYPHLGLSTDGLVAAIADFEWLDFMLGACGATGRAKLIKELRSVLA